MKLGRRDEAVERVGEIAQVGQFGGAWGVALFAEAVDPDGAQAELGGGGEIVEGARTDVDVAILVGMASVEELLPVAGGGVVRAGFRGRDREIHWPAGAVHPGRE